MVCYGVSYIGAQESIYSVYVTTGFSLWMVPRNPFTTIFQTMSYHVLLFPFIPDYALQLFISGKLHTDAANNIFRMRTARPQSSRRLGLSLCLKPPESRLHGIFSSVPLAWNALLRLILPVSLTFYNASNPLVLMCSLVFHVLHSGMKLIYNGGREYPRRQRL